MIPTPPDCQDCAACCFSRLAHYVRVTGDDHARMGDRADSLVVWGGNRAYLRMAEERCAALEFDSQSGRFQCGAYEVRPATCRDLERGSPECAGEIAEKGARPEAWRVARGLISDAAGSVEANRS